MKRPLGHYRDPHRSNPGERIVCGRRCSSKRESTPCYPYYQQRHNQNEAKELEGKLVAIGCSQFGAIHQLTKLQTIQDNAFLCLAKTFLKSEGLLMMYRLITRINPIGSGSQSRSSCACYGTVREGSEVDGFGS